MAKHRCSQCDKELPQTWADATNSNWDPVCPECASRDLKKKSLRRRRILDTSVRLKSSLDMQIQKPAQAPQQVAPQASPQVQPQSGSSRRAHMPMEIELDTDDPLLLAAHGEQDKEEKQEEPGNVVNLEETTQIRRPKPPAGPQVRLNF